MRLPVACVETCVLDRVSAVDHHAVTDIDSDVRSAARIIRSLEEHQITGFHVGRRYAGADLP